MGRYATGYPYARSLESVLPGTEDRGLGQPAVAKTAVERESFQAVSAFLRAAGWDIPRTGRARDAPQKTARMGLSFFWGMVILGPCRFTSFIARSASRTVKSSFVPATGRGPSARAAVRQSSRRNFRYSHPQQGTEATLPPVKAAAVAAAVVAAAARTGTERRYIVES